MNKCIWFVFLDDIFINILKIVDNIVLLILNKCRYLFWLYVNKIFVIYKFNKEKL